MAFSKNGLMVLLNDQCSDGKIQDGVKIHLNSYFHSKVLILPPQSHKLFSSFDQSQKNLKTNLVKSVDVLKFECNFTKDFGHIKSWKQQKV